MNVTVRAYDHGRAETIVEMATRMWRLLTGLGAAHAKLSSWHARARDGALLPLEGARDCREAIEQRAYTWTSGKKEQVAYGPIVVAGAGAPYAEIAVVCGVEPSAVWTPNQVQIILHESLKIDRSDPGPYLAILQALALAYEPAWGHVAVGALPPAPMPPFTNGAPVVGWITFMSRAYPLAPPVHPPAVAYPVEKGTMFVAHPKGADPESIEGLRRALAEANMLLPAMEVRSRG